MTKHFIIICTLLLATGLYGQGFHAVRSGSQSAVDPASLTQEILQLQSDSAALSQANIRLTTLKAELEQKMTGQTSEAEQDSKHWSTLYNNICTSLLDNNGLLLKHILVFPLERSYDTQKVSDALDFIDTLSNLGFSDKRFTSLTDKYKPLLLGYDKYNRQLKQFVQDRIKDIDNAGRDYVPEYSSWTARLESLEYYPVFRNKHKSPSIPYLDERIEEILSIVRRKPTETRAVKTELNEIKGKL